MQFREGDSQVCIRGGRFSRVYVTRDGGLAGGKQKKRIRVEKERTKEKRRLLKKVRLLKLIKEPQGSILQITRGKSKQVGAKDINCQ